MGSNLLERAELVAGIAEKMLDAYVKHAPFQLSAEEHHVFFEESLSAVGSSVEELVAAKERYEKKVIARRLHAVPEVTQQ